MSKQINPIEQLEFLKQFEQEIAAEKSIMMQKALTSQDPHTLVKAQQLWADVQQRKDTGFKTQLFDPWDPGQHLDYKAKPVSISYETLRRMSRTPIIKAIIQTRVEQCAAFSEPAKRSYDIGFVIKKKGIEVRDIDKKMTKKERLEADRITEFLLNGGDNDNSWHFDTFDTHVRKIVPDSLALDQGCFEVVRNRKGIPVEFLTVDGATMRLAQSFDDEKWKNKASTNSMNIKMIPVRGYYPSYVQVMDSRPVAEYYPWELSFGIRNPSTNIYNNGYGESELEVLIQIITWMLNSDTYNGNFFKQGSAPKGFLRIKNGGTKIEEFRQYWRAMTQGVYNSWRTPILESEDVEWVDMHKGNDEMGFEKWQEYLLRVACANYKMDPSEISFHLAGGTDAKTIFESSNEYKLKYSKDKGLKPLLKHYKRRWNKYIVKPLNPEFELTLAGLEEDENEEYERDFKAVGSTMGYMEFREKWYGKRELEEDDLIMNPVFMQAKQMEQMGNQESDAFVDQNYGGGFQDDVEQFGQAYRENNQQDQDNPFLKELNDFMNTEFE